MTGITYSWGTDISGNWSNGADWSRAGAPTSVDTANFEATGAAYIVTVNSAAAADDVLVSSADATLQIDGGYSLTIGNLLTLASGILTINGSLDLAATASLDLNGGAAKLGGTVNGGTIDDSLGELDVSGGTLNGVTYVGTLNLTGTSQELYVGQNGLVVEPSLGSNNPGQVNLTGDNAQINFEGTQTFDDAVIDIGNNAGNSILYTDSTNAALTLGAKLTIDQTGHYAEILNYDSGSSITNEGTIEAELKGGTFTISNYAFTNAGTIDIANGDTVNLGNGMTSFVNTGGTIDVGAGSTLNLQGNALATGDLGTINDSGTLIISGTLANGGETFTLPGATTLTGTIDGGTIDDSLGELDVAGGTLNGVTYVGTLQLTGTSQELYVGPKGLVVEPSLGSNNPGQVNLTGDNAQINFEGTQTFDDAVIDIGNNAGNSFIYTDSTNAALTLGAKLTIDQTGLYAEIQNYDSGSSITNEGTIEAEFAGGTFTISNDAFANDGTIDAANGDKVNITSTLTNYSANTLTGGTFEADAGSEIDMTTSGVIETDQADIILSGTGSIQSGNTGNNQSPESLAASLTTIGASGELVLKGGAVFATANAFTNQGTLDLQSGTFTDASLSNAVGATLQGYGTVTDALTSNGSIVAQGGTLDLKGAVSGAGGLTIDAGSTLELGGADSQEVNFSGANAVLKLDDTSGFSGILAGLVVGDAIDLSGLSVSSAAVDGSTLTATLANKNTLNFQLTQFPSGDIFTVASDGAGGSLLTVAVPPPPTINAPASATLGVGRSGAISNLSISATDPGATEIFTVTLSDTSGDLTATGTGVTGSGTNSLTISGTFSQVNADLATLVDMNAAAGTDAIVVKAEDGFGHAANAASIGVTVASDPVLTAPANATVAQDQATAISGLVLSETGAAAGETFTVGLTDGSGDLVTAGTGGQIVGSGTNSLTIIGTLAQVNADLADLMDIDPSTTGDTIGIAATDSFGNAAAAATIAITETAAPTASIAAVDGDDVINAADAAAGVSVSGTSTGFASGATFSLVVVDGASSNAYVATVGTGGAWTASIPAAAAVALKDGTATFTAKFGGATLATQIVTVAETLPTLTISAIGADDAINVAEAAAGVSISGTSTGLAVGATFMVAVVDNGVTDSYQATVGVGGAWTATMPSADASALAEGAAVVSAQARDAHGNVSAVARQDVTVATIDPVIAAPANATVAQGQTTAISDLSLSETGAAAGETFTVVITDANGDLATVGTGGTIKGSGTNSLTISGTLAQIDNDLGGLTDNDASTADDTIKITASDGFGNAATPSSIAVSVTPRAKPGTPSINAPAAAQFGLLDEPGGIAGVSVAETNPANNEIFTVTLTDTVGGLSTTKTEGTVTGENSHALKIVGTLAQVDDDLATLTYGGLAGGTDTIKINAGDSLGGTATTTSIAVSYNGDIDVSLPPAAGYVQNQASAIQGLEISETGNTTGETFRVTLQALDGDLTTSGGQGTISGNGKSTLTISGSLAQVNQDLAALSVTDASATTDKVSITAFDSIDNETSNSFTVTAETLGLNPVGAFNAFNHADAASGATLSGTSTGFATGETVSISVVDGDVTKTFTTTIGANGAWSVAMPKADVAALANGEASVTAKIGDLASATESVTVAETLPTVTISPIGGNDLITLADATNGFQISGATTGLAQGATFQVTISETAGANSVALLATATVGADGAWTATVSAAEATSLFDGSGSVSAEPVDAYGNPAATATQIVTIAVAAPVVTIAKVDGDNEITSANIAAGVSITGTVTGLLAEGSTFTIDLDETGGGAGLQATATVGANGTWRATISPTIARQLTDGSWTVYAQASDPYGDLSNLADDVVTVELTPGPPVVHWATPVTLGVNQASPVTGISLTQSNPVSTETQTVKLVDPNGVLGLSATAAAGSTVTGQGTHDLTIRGTLAQVNADLALVTDKETAVGSGKITLSASDSEGQAAGPIAINLNIVAAPLIAAPTGASVFEGQPTSIPGFSVSATGDTAQETFTATLTDASGLLTTAGTAGTIAGSGTTSLTIIGTLAQVNADLTQIFDDDAGSATDTITVTAKDGFGNSAQSKTVTVTPEAASTAIAIKTPSAPGIAVGQETGIPGIVVTDASAGASDAFLVTVTDTDGLLSDAGKAGTVTALTARSVQIAGTLAQVNADLASLEDKDSSANPDTLAIVATDTTTKSSAGRFVGVTVIGAPVITAPTSATVTAGLDSLASQIPGLSLSESNAAAGEIFTLTLTVSNGAVSVGDEGTVKTNSGGATLKGTLAQINADLQLLTFSTPTATSATIGISASDGYGNTATTKSIAVTIDVAQVSVPTFQSEETSLNAIVRGFDIADTGADVAGDISGLEQDEAHIDAIDLSSGIVGATVAQFRADETILNKIAGGFDISDTAANVQGDLAGLEADASHIGSIGASGGTVDAAVAQFGADETVLNKIVGGFDITDTGAKVQADLSGLEADASLIDLITLSSGTVSVDIADYESDKKILDTIKGGFNVDIAKTEPQSDLTNDLSDLQLISGGHLNSVVLSGQTISVSVQTYAGYAATLNKIAGGYLDISDTGAEVTAGLSTLKAYESYLHAISVTGGVVDLTAAQDSGDASLIAKMTGDFVTDVATSATTTTTTGHGDGLTIDDVAGADTIIGGGNGETFVFAYGFGTATIMDFHSHLSGSGHDTIELQAKMFGQTSKSAQSADWSALLADAKASGANVVITDKAGDALTLDGLTLAALKTSSADFKFT